VLRFGYLGVLSFLAMGLFAAGVYGSMARSQGLRRGLFAASMASAILAALLIMVTVWMPHDYGFWFMWTVGTAAGLRSHV
jgi:hypothetical protein